ncbi:MAG: hypothetical protein NTW94_09570 [Legionellales bacterium]|nr:hypothetical protein [Legionellales bacterium]
MKHQLSIICLALILMSGSQVFAKTAVGNYRNINNNILPLSYTSKDDTHWALSKALPLPFDVAGSQKSILQGVTCDKTGVHCCAVGFYQSTSNNIVPFSFSSQNGGATWSLSNPFPLPIDVASNGVQKSELHSITCDETGVHCVTVGQYMTNTNSIVPFIYTSNNSGVSWSLTGTLLKPSDTAAVGNQLSSLLSND